MIWFAIWNAPRTRAAVQNKTKSCQMLSHHLKYFTDLLLLEGQDGPTHHRKMRLTLDSLLSLGLGRLGGQISLATMAKNKIKRHGRLHRPSAGQLTLRVEMFKSTGGEVVKTRWRIDLKIWCQNNYFVFSAAKLFDDTSPEYPQVALIGKFYSHHFTHPLAVLASPKPKAFLRRWAASGKHARQKLSTRVMPKWREGGVGLGTLLGYSWASVKYDEICKHRVYRWE